MGHRCRKSTWIVTLLAASRKRQLAARNCYRLGYDCPDSKKSQIDGMKVVDSNDLKETGAERNARKDEELAVAASYYNEEVDSELDKVVCKKEQVVGSRRKVRVCKTVRQIEEEKAASQRLMMRRNRWGTSPADVEGNAN